MCPDHMDDPFLDSEDEDEGDVAAVASPKAGGNTADHAAADGSPLLPLSLGKHLKGEHRGHLT